MRTEAEIGATEEGPAVGAREKAPGVTENEGIREFLAALLSHDAVDDAVTELLFEHVVEGRYHPAVIAASLPPLVEEILGATRAEDWQLLGEVLIIEGPSAVGGRAIKESAGAERRVTEQGMRIDVGLIRDLLWLALTHPLNESRLAALRAELADRGDTHPAVIAEALRGSSRAPCGRPARGAGT